MQTFTPVHTAQQSFVLLAPHIQPVIQVPKTASVTTMLPAVLQAVAQQSSMVTTPVVTPNRIIRLKQVLELTGLKRSAIYDRMDCKSPRYDASFPKQFKLCGATSKNSAVGWLEAEILAWINQLAQRRQFF